MSELSDLGVKYADKPRTDCRGDESVSTPASDTAAAAASMGQRFGNSTQLSFAVMNRTYVVRERVPNNWQWCWLYRDYSLRVCHWGQSMQKVAVVGGGCLLVRRYVTYL